MVVACDEISIAALTSLPAGAANAGVPSHTTTPIVAHAASIAILFMALRSLIAIAASTAQWNPR
jgi:hypothetical protein